MSQNRTRDKPTVDITQLERMLKQMRDDRLNKQSAKNDITGPGAQMLQEIARTSAGKVVTERNAMQLTTVYAFAQSRKQLPVYLCIYTAIRTAARRKQSIIRFIISYTTSRTPKCRLSLFAKRS